LCDIVFEFRKEINLTFAFNMWSGLQQRNILSPLFVRSVSQTCEKRLFTSSWLSVLLLVRLSAWNKAVPTGLIFIKLTFEYFFENLTRKFNFRKNRTKI